MPLNRSQGRRRGQPLIAGLHPKGVDQAENIAQQGQNDIENKRPAEAFPSSTPSGGRMIVKTILQNPITSPFV